MTVSNPPGADTDQLRAEGISARKRAERLHQHALVLMLPSPDWSTRAFQRAEEAFLLSQTYLIEASDIVELYRTRGLLGALRFDRGRLRDGIDLIYEAIAVLRQQEDEVAELDVLIHLLRRWRPESWLKLRRAFWLTRKGSPGAARRWEVIAATIGDDIYAWAKAHRARKAAA